MQMQLGYDDCVELLGYAATKRKVLEILGYESSKVGMSQWLKERPPIAAMLVAWVAADLREYGVFPRDVNPKRPPDCGIYAEAKEKLYAVIDIDKPSAWSKFWFDNAEDAAKDLIRRRMDPAWIPELQEAIKPIREETSLDRPNWFN